MKIQLEIEKVCDVTKRVIKDFNHMTDNEFLRKYSCHKNTYLKRVMKYGDPYMNAPLAKIGKILKRFM